VAVGLDDACAHLAPGAVPAYRGRPGETECPFLPTRAFLDAWFHVRRP
jgi:hypothetical protein